MVTPVVLLAYKGTDGDSYMLEIDPATGQLPVTTAAAGTNDFGSSTQAARTAALIGNSTGAAAFGAGATSAQTIRTVLATDQSAIPAAQSGTWTVSATQSGTWNVTNISGTVSLPTGASTEATLAAANTKLVAGTNGIKTDSYQAGTWTTAATQSGTWTVTQSGTWTTQSVQSGAWTVAATQSGVWTAAQSGAWTVAATQSGSWSIANLPTTVDTNAGAAGASTLRVAFATGQAAIKVAQQGRSLVAYANLTYSSTTSAAFTAITLAPATALASAATQLAFSDSGGQPMLLAYDPAGGTSFTINLLALAANASGTMDVTIPSGASIGVKSLGSTVTSGSLVLNILG